MNKPIISALILLLFLMTSMAAEASNDGDNRDSITGTHHIGMKFSFISHSGFYYGHQISENWQLGGGGYYYFEKEDGATDSITELGLELQHSIYRSAGFSLYALAGVGYQHQRRNFQNDREWFQSGIGLGLMNQTSSGLTVNADIGVLRYRKTTRGSSERVVVGLGFGIGIGYRF